MPVQEVCPPGTGADAPNLFAKTLDYVAALCVLLLKRKSIEFEGGPAVFTSSSFSSHLG